MLVRESHDRVQSPGAHRKGQGAVVDGPITRTPDLESQKSFRRGLRRSPTSSSPLLPLPCEVDTQEGLHQCLCSLLLALFSPCPSELKSDPFPDPPPPVSLSTQSLLDPRAKIQRLTPSPVWSLLLLLEALNLICHPLSPAPC